jgi:hypothetical protein
MKYTITEIANLCLVMLLQCIFGQDAFVNYADVEQKEKWISTCGDK